jgi:hypothetical protein
MSHTVPPRTPFDLAVDLAEAARNAAIHCLQHARFLLDTILQPEMVASLGVGPALQNTGHGPRPPHAGPGATRLCLDRSLAALEAADATGLLGHWNAYDLLRRVHQAIERGSRARQDLDEIAASVVGTVQATGLVRLSEDEFKHQVSQIDRERRELIPHLVLLAERGRLPRVPDTSRPTSPQSTPAEALSNSSEEKDQPRPEHPSIAYCLSEPHTVRWEKTPVELEGVHRKLLQTLLRDIEQHADRNNPLWWKTWRIRKGKLSGVFPRGGANVANQTVRNACSKLNNKLEDVSFPYTFGYCEVEERIKLANEPT